MNIQANWEIELYTRSDGTSPVAEFIEKQPTEDEATIHSEFNELAEFGLMPRGATLEHLEGKLWKLSFSAQRSRLHFIFFAPTNSTFVILNGFRRKSHTTPERELAAAHNMLQDYLERHSQK